jgi:predicted phosphatase
VSKDEHIDPIPDEFESYEEAAEFWDTHDTTDYPEAFHTVDAVTEFRSRHYEVEIEEEVVRKLQMQARQQGVTVGRLASDLLRQQLASPG